MIYHISKILTPKLGALNILHYVSVRAIFALLTSLALSFLLGEWFIEESQKRFKSKARKYTPSENQKQKNSTPTMGGLFILGIFTTSTLLWNNLLKAQVWIFLLCSLGFGAIGFLDDWAKIKQSVGMRAKRKFMLQILLAAIVMCFWQFTSSPNTELCIPFFKNFSPSLGITIIPWGIFILVATSNAVNLTDGLDGLATGPLMFNFAAFSVMCYLAGHQQFANYLFIPFADSTEMAIIGASLIGTLLGFLWYNTYPAQIFMGDVGSLALGSALGFIAIIARQELLLLLASGIFVVETVSVIIQVISFKLTGKRIFKMAPIHHHYELLGWSEPKITVRFWIISMVLSLLALLTLKIR